MKARLIHGDCLEELKALPERSVDSLVTDPPAGISFMGKAWDHHKGGMDAWVEWMQTVMTECLRVMKPGAHGLVWALPRTSHWTGMALERAGFEVRDIVTHLFGSGFPKSLDVSKAIDKMNGDTRPVVSTKKKLQSYGANEIFGSGPEKHGVQEITSAASAGWTGWGTALKPAAEMWILVRKPLSEPTVAKNILKWGTGALNIDASRIGFSSECDRKKAEWGSKGGGEGWGMKPGADVLPTNFLGRFPANLVFSHTPDCTDDACTDDCAVRELDAQSGNSKGGKRGPANDAGGASRFFYCAKTSSSERNAATTNGHPTVKPQKLMRYLINLITPPNGMVLDPFMGSGSTGLAAKTNDFGFIGIEREKEYFDIAEKRINMTQCSGTAVELDNA
jgi:DNA modification methylase